MISEEKFSEIIIKHMTAIMDEVNQNGNASAYQYTDQMANMVVSVLMTITDKMDTPRIESMSYLAGDLVQKIMEQTKFQVDNDDKK